MEKLLHKTMRAFVNTDTTFEEHISRPNSASGYKMENIYQFEGGKLIGL